MHSLSGEYVMETFENISGYRFRSLAGIIYAACVESCGGFYAGLKFVLLLNRFLLRLLLCVRIMNLITQPIVLMFCHVRMKQLFQFTSSSPCELTSQLNVVKRNKTTFDKRCWHIYCPVPPL